MRGSSRYFKEIPIGKRFRRELQLWIKLSENEARTVDERVRATFEPYDLVNLP